MKSCPGVMEATWKRQDGNRGLLIRLKQGAKLSNRSSIYLDTRNISYERIHCAALLILHIFGS